MLGSEEVVAGGGAAVDGEDDGVGSGAGVEGSAAGVDVGATVGSSAGVVTGGGETDWSDMMIYVKLRVQIMSRAFFLARKDGFPSGMGPR